MNLFDLPEGVRFVAAETLSQIIAINLYDRDSTFKRADFITQAFIRIYGNESSFNLN